MADSQRPDVSLQWINHLVYCTADLEQTLNHFELELGVRPALGGFDPAWQTHNAVLSLGKDLYLEIVAPDPSAGSRLTSIEPDDDESHSDDEDITDTITDSPFFYDEVITEKLITFAIKVPNQFDGMDEFLQASRDAGYDPGRSESGSRICPDGSIQTWQIAIQKGIKLTGQGIIPFIVDWVDNSNHPSRIAAPGCELISLRGRHPHPEQLKAALEALRIPLSLELGPKPQLIATLSCPKGIVELSEGFVVKPIDLMR